MLGLVCSFIRDKRKWTAVPLTTDLNPSKDFPSLLTTFGFQAPWSTAKLKIYSQTLKKRTPHSSFQKILQELTDKFLALSGIFWNLTRNSRILQRAVIQESAPLTEQIKCTYRYQRIFSTTGRCCGTSMASCRSGCPLVIFCPSFWYPLPLLTQHKCMICVRQVWQDCSHQTDPSYAWHTSFFNICS